MLLPGDGIGPEIIREATKALNAIAQKFGHIFHFTQGQIGASAIEKCGAPYPGQTHNLCLEADAILFGAVGHPIYDNNPNAQVRPEQGLLKMRKELELYANIRPVEIYSSLVERSPLKASVIKGANLVIVRELTGGLYFGEPRGRSEQGDKAFDTLTYSTTEIERVAHVAFDLALKRESELGRKAKVTLVDKANVLATSRLWREVVSNLHKKQYSNVILDYLYVDNAAMQLVTSPSNFDIILTENMFGDILSDEASVITGSIGLLPSASIGKKYCLFEPIHGSYPQAAGKNIANPIASILSAAMLLQIAFSLDKEALLLKECCAAAIKEGVLTPELGGNFSTEEVGSWICSQINKQ